VATVGERNRSPGVGTFTAGQREIWNLLIDAYRVGIKTMKPG
jgi:hypothetical protein